MAVGAMFGALNTMYAAIGERAREIATLRAIGFGAAAVVVAVMLETIVLALGGALSAGASPQLIFNGSSPPLQFSTGFPGRFAAGHPGLLCTGLHVGAPSSALPAACSRRARGAGAGHGRAPSGCLIATLDPSFAVRLSEPSAEGFRTLMVRDRRS